MSDDSTYWIGDKKRSHLLVKEILPALESMILNASRDFYTVKDAMRVLSISRTQLYYLRVRGLLEFKRVGTRVYITREAIHKLVMSNGQVDVDSASKSAGMSHL